MILKYKYCMKILMVHAMDEEKGNIELPGHELYFCQTGFGKVKAGLAAFAAILDTKPDLVLNFGSSGSINHEIGEIFICSRFVDRDLKKVAIPGIISELDFSQELENASLFRNHINTYSVNTGDSFVLNPEDAGDDSDVIDMEAFAIASACKKTNLPFISVKYVSDVVGKNSVKAWIDKLYDTKIELEKFIGNLSIID